MINTLLGKRKILVKKEEPSLAMEPDSDAIYWLPFLRLPLLQEIEPLMCWIRYVCMRSVRISQFGLEGSEFDSSLNITVSLRVRTVAGEKRREAELWHKTCKILGHDESKSEAGSHGPLTIHLTFSKLNQIYEEQLDKKIISKYWGENFNAWH